MTVGEFNAELVNVSMGYLVLDNDGNVVSSVDPDIIYVDFEGDCNYKKWNGNLLRWCVPLIKRAGNNEVIAMKYYTAEEFYKMVLQMEEVIKYMEAL